jgi:hypothetical protein
MKGTPAVFNAMANRDGLISTTNRFPRINATEVAAKLNLESLGRANSSRSDAQTLDDSVEQSVRRELQTHIAKAHAEYNGALDTTARRLANASFPATVAVRIEAECRKALADFRNLVSSEDQSIETLRRKLHQISRQLETFVDANGLQNTSPIIVSSGSLALSASLLVAFVVIEAVANAFFFAEGSTSGLLGGFFIAAALSFVNITAAFVTGYGLMPYTRHKRLIRRVLGVIATTALLCTIVGVNLLVAHYRDAYVATPGVEPDFGLIIVHLQQNPLNLSSAKSWLLFAFGTILAAGAIWKSSAMRDPYPGYGALAKRHQLAETELNRAIQDALADLQERHNDGTNKLTERLNEVTQAKEDRRMALEHRERLRSEFSDYLVGMRDDYRYLATVYQEAAGRNTVISPLDTPAVPPFPAEPDYDESAVDAAIAAMKIAIAQLDDAHRAAAARLTGKETGPQAN